LRSVDKNCRIDDGTDWDNAVNQLLNCGTGLPNGRDSVATRSTNKHGYSLGNVVTKAQDADKENVVKYFKEKVVQILDPQMMKLAVLALLDIIEHDKFDDDVVIDLIAGKTKNAPLAQSEFVTAEFLANMFLYTAICVDNKGSKQEVYKINEEYVHSFEPKRDTIILVDKLTETDDTSINDEENYSANSATSETTQTLNNYGGIFNIKGNFVVNNGVYNNFS